MNRTKQTLIFFALVFTVSLSAQQMQVGLASYYNDGLHGHATALGETYDRNAYTCAHLWHPKGTLLRVTNLDNHQTVTVRVNDRGPYTEGYVVSLSLVAANAIGLTLSGKAQVGIEPVGFSEQSVYASGVPSVNVPAPRNTGELTDRGLSFAGAEPGEAIRRLQATPGAYTIQTGAYTDYNNASSNILSLQQRGLRDVFLLEGANSSGVVYRVVIGLFADRTMGERLLEQLKLDYQLTGIIIPAR